MGLFGQGTMKHVGALDVGNRISVYEDLFYVFCAVHAFVTGIFLRPVSQKC